MRPVKDSQLVHRSVAIQSSFSSAYVLFLHLLFGTEIEDASMPQDLQEKSLVSLALVTVFPIAQTIGKKERQSSRYSINFVFPSTCSAFTAASGTSAQDRSMNMLAPPKNVRTSITSF